MKVRYFVSGFVVLIISLALMSGCNNNSENDQNEKDRIFAAHVVELKSLPTTPVVTPLGAKGFISTLWVESGLSHKYSLKEYMAAVLVPSKGVSVDTPVEGDRFIAPWHK